MTDAKSDPSSNELPLSDDFGWDDCDFPLQGKENSISASRGSFAHVEPPAFGIISDTPSFNTYVLQVIGYIKLLLFLKKIRELEME